MARPSLRRLRAWTSAVNDVGARLGSLSDGELRARADALRERARSGQGLDHLLPEAFALVRETSDRLLGQRHYDVQVMGGVALHLGSIAEMGTGEGKTLVAALPSFLHALTGDGVHVVTANDYLAARDAEKMGRVLGHLGLSVGTVVSDVPRSSRPPEYAADVTYATSTELGFDFLHDNLALAPGEEVQRGRHSAIVDEIDSVLIDEARTPLIIAGMGEVDADRYVAMAALVRGWRSGVDFDVEPTAKWAWLLDPGIETLQRELGIDNIYQRQHAGTLQMVSNLLRAQRTYVRDRDYVVIGDEIQLVDANTGRVLPGRRLEEGLHQAIEALEGVEVRPDTETLASITLQNYFRLYDRLGGMTGTAAQEADEFENVYDLPTVHIPPNRRPRRVDRRDAVFRTRAEKIDHVVRETRQRQERGQPVLIGTASVQASEELSRALELSGVPHRVLNAKLLAEEAEVIATAGRLGAVTVATDMAGRGTDIVLGGSAEDRATRDLADRGLDPGHDAYDRRWRELISRHVQESKAEHDHVLELGGLFVLGTERHHSRRIDDQLRGRCGRQGDPGETRFFVSLEDDLVLEHELPRVRRLLNKRRPPAGPIEDPKVVVVVGDAQRASETRDREMRKHMLEYDDLLREQRAVVYRNRRRLLHEEEIDEWVEQVVTKAVARTVRHALKAKHPGPDDLDQLALVTALLYPHNVDIRSLASRHTRGRQLEVAAVVDEFVEDARLVLDDRRRWLTRAHVAGVARRTALEAIDRGWREHLAALEVVRDGIHLRTYGSRDPLAEYRIEGHHLFRELERSVREQVTRAVLQE